MIATGLALSLALVATACPKDSGGGGDTSQPSADTPEFDFSVGKVVTIPTGVKERGIQEKGKPVADEVAVFMTGLYKALFLDPANWQEGSYTTAWEMFDRAAVSGAKADVAVLTPGTEAGGAFDSIEPTPAEQNLPVKVLLDAKDQPLQAVAIVTFTATGKDSDGGEDTKIVSKGQFFLKPSGDSWLVYGYRAGRVDSGPGAAAPSKPANSPEESPA